MSIESIAFDHFSETTNPGMVSAPQSHTCHTVCSIIFFWLLQKRFFHNIHKQQTHHGIIEATKNLSSKLSKIWENIDGCDEHYRCDIVRGLIALGYGRYLVYGLNYTDKRFFFLLMKTVQLPD